MPLWAIGLGDCLADGISGRFGDRFPLEVVIGIYDVVVEARPYVLCG